MASHARVLPRDRYSLVWSRELSGRFAWIASFLYLAALATNLTYVLRNECGFAFLPGRPEIFAGAIAFLLVFELWAHRRYGDRMTREVGIRLIAARILIFESAAVLDCSNFAITLYMLLPFLAIIFINKWAAMGLGAVFTSWVAVKVGLFRCPDCPVDQNITPVLILAVGMIWSMAMGGLVRGVELGRSRTKRLLVDLEQSNRQLKNYASRVQELAAAEERNRLARDIHDSVGHSLAVVNVQLEKALVFHQRDPGVAEQAIKDAKRAAREALGDVRASVRTLRQTTEDFSLSEALAKLAERSRSDVLDVDLQVDGVEAGYPRPALMALYRAAQEGLTNVHKHAGASQVRVAVRFAEDTAQLEIRDNGKGFEPEEIEGMPARRQERYGLLGIRERLELVGGTMQVESGPGAGTRLNVVIPKRRLTGDPARGSRDR